MCYKYSVESPSYLNLLALNVQHLPVKKLKNNLVSVHSTISFHVGNKYV